jgi:hypothetical protein
LWWKNNFKDVQKNFKGDRYSHADFAGVEKAFCKSVRNSGANAIYLAASLGAETIYLIGFDCHKRNGTHWHGDHPKPMTSCKSIGTWASIFGSVSKDLAKLNIINVTRDSDLTCFPKQSLESVL